jgi:hypothetical protein
MHRYCAPMTTAFDWDGDWNAIESETERRELEAELQREAHPAHVLHGHTAVALGRRWRRDDILFLLDDGRFAQVHLTWRPETKPEWPWTNIFPTFEAWKTVPVADR